MSINNFITHFLSFYSIQEQILTDEGNYQLLYYTFLDFCSNHKQILMIHHFLGEFYHIFLESYIDQEHILIDKVIFNYILTQFLFLR